MCGPCTAHPTSHTSLQVTESYQEDVTNSGRWRKVVVQEEPLGVWPVPPRSEWQGCRFTVAELRERVREYFQVCVELQRK